jgi:hypothetical protein
MHSATIKKIPSTRHENIHVIFVANSTGKLTRLIYFKSPDALNHEERMFL